MTAWVTAYNAEYTKTLIRQLVAFVQRDIRAALDFVGGVDNLPVFANYQVAFSPMNQFPGILIAPMDSVFVQEAVGTRQSSNRIYCAVAVSHQDTQVLAELSQDYVRALDAIFMTLPLSDFYSSWPLTLSFFSPVSGNAPASAGSVKTSALAAGSVKELWVASHNYDEIRRQRQSFVQSAVLEIRIDREEI